MKRLILFLMAVSCWAQMLPFPGPGMPGSGGGGGTAPVMTASICGPASPGVNGGVSGTLGSVSGSPNFVVITASFNGGTTPTTPTDSNSNTYTALTGFTAGTPSLQIYYAQGATVTTGMTFTVAGSGVFDGFCALTFTNMDASAVYETGTWKSAAGLVPGSATPSFSGNNVFIAMAGSAGNNTYSINSGYTASTAIAFNSGVNFGAQPAYLVQIGTAAQSPTFTATSGSGGNTAQAVFKGAH